MSVRFKIFICLIGVGASLWLASAYFATQVFQGDFDKLDEKRITNNVNRVYRLIQDSQNRALNACQLWENGSTASDPSNFLRTIMETNDVSLITTFNANGSVRDSLAIPRGGNAVAASLPQADLALFRQQIEQARAQAAPVIGIIETSQGPLLFAADAQLTGANAGSGVFSAIVLDEAFNQRLERSLLMDLRLVTATEDLLKRFPPGKDEIIYQPNSIADSNFIGARLLRDIHGKPLVVLEVVATKEISIAGQQNLQFFLGITAAVGIVIIILGTVLVDLLVVRRVRKLTLSARHADQFGSMEDLPRRFIKVPDEISQLAQAIRRMLERMRSSQAMYRAVIETQTEMIVRYAPDGTITFTNEAFAKWLTLHPKSVLGENIHKLLAERADATPLQSPIDPSSRHRKLMISTHEKDLTHRTLEWNEHGIFDAARKLTEVQALGRDVTEQVEHEARLREARDQAQQADFAKGEFLAVLGHETRTPLTSILGFSGILEKTPINDEQKEYLSAIRSSGQSLLTLLNDILDYTRIAAGQIELHPKTVNVIEVLKEIIATHTIEARAKELNLDTEIAPEAPLYIVADETRLKQVLSNLVGNAIKFTQQGYVRFGVRAEGESHICFFVEDSGEGIPLEKRHLLFKPFSQLQPALTRDVGGTGIGLAFSKRLVELMQGTIGIGQENRPGSFFYVELPIGKPDVPQRSSARLAEMIAFDSGISSEVRILLVEDNKVNQKLTSRLLEMIGFKCDIASDGAECLEMTDIQDYDLIFLDIQMPRIDGFETARQLRQRELNSSSGHYTYIIALTAFTLPGDREKCLEAGMDNFVGKPIRIESIEAAIESWRKEMLPLNAGE